MSVDPAEIAEVREKFAARPGHGHLVEQALAERATAQAYGHDTSRADKILAGVGYEPRDVAAAKRKEAAKREAAKAAEDEAAAAEAAKRTPPSGRSSRPGRDTG